MCSSVANPSARSGELPWYLTLTRNMLVICDINKVLRTAVHPEGNDSTQSHSRKQEHLPNVQQGVWRRRQDTDVTWVGSPQTGKKLQCRSQPHSVYMRKGNVQGQGTTTGPRAQWIEKSNSPEYREKGMGWAPGAGMKRTKRPSFLIHFTSIT